MPNIITRTWTAVFNPWTTTGDGTPVTIINPTIDATTGYVSTPAVRSLVPLNQDSALSIGAVYRGVQIISTSVCQMPLQVWRGTDLLDTPSYIKRPDFNMNVNHFIEMTVSSLALNGNAYWRVTRNQSGGITNIEVLPPTLVTVEVDDKTGKKRYSYDSKYYSPKEMQHLQLMRVPGYVYGLGPIQRVRGELELALDLREYTGHWFSKSGVPTGILKTDQPLSEEWAESYKARWQKVMEGVEKTAVLGNGLTYISTYLNPKDALFVEVINSNLQAVARMFGIPASLMSLPLEGNSMTYSNTRDENNQFLKYTLSVYMQEIENAFTELVPRGQEVRFDTTALLRMNEADRFANYAIAIQNGWMSPEEVRKKEGLQGPAPKPQPMAKAPSVSATTNVKADVKQGVKE